MKNDFVTILFIIVMNVILNSCSTQIELDPPKKTGSLTNDTTSRANIGGRVVKSPQYDGKKFPKGLYRLPMMMGQALIH